MFYLVQKIRKNIDIKADKGSLLTLDSNDNLELVDSKKFFEGLSFFQKYRCYSGDYLNCILNKVELISAQHARVFAELCQEDLALNKPLQDVASRCHRIQTLNQEQKALFSAISHSIKASKKYFCQESFEVVSIVYSIMYVFESTISGLLNPFRLFSRLKSIRFDSRFQALISKKEAISGKSRISIHGNLCRPKWMSRYPLGN